MNNGSLKQWVNDTAFFRYLWKKRPHKCQITGAKLWVFSPWFFAHVLGKQAYPRFRYYEKNIITIKGELHHLLDHHTDKAKLDPRFDWVFKLQEQLKQEYYDH